MSRQISISSYLDTLGWVYFRLRDLEKAKVYLEASHELFPHHAALVHLTWLYFELGDMTLARKFGERAALGPPGSTPPKLPPQLGIRPDQLLTPQRFEGGGKSVEIRREIRIVPLSSGSKAPVEPFEEATGATRPIHGDDQTLAWPKGLARPEASPQRVRIVCLVDFNGRVLDSDKVTGDDPWSKAALEKAGGLRFEPIQWGNPSVRLFRVAVFVFSPDNTVRVFEPKVPIGLPGLELASPPGAGN